MTPLERAAVEWHNVVATSHTSEWSFERSQAAQRRLMEAAWKAGEDAAATSATASTPPPATDEMKAMQDILVEQGLVPPKYEAGNPASATIAAPIAPPEVERDTVDFYEREFYPLSNFSAFNLRWNGSTYQTSEHAYQAMKFDMDAPEVARTIYHAPSAHEAFKIAERHRDARRPDWDAVKVDVMRHILHAKVQQHEYVRRKLLETGDRQLIECSWRDDFWGWGPHRDGQNMLGKLWMEIRAEMRTPPPQEGGNHGAEATRQQSSTPAVRDVAVRCVPREPTEAMVRRAYDISDESRFFIDRLPDYWRAMWDAAPLSLVNKESAAPIAAPVAWMYESADRKQRTWMTTRCPAWRDDKHPDPFPVETPLYAAPVAAPVGKDAERLDWLETEMDRERVRELHLTWSLFRRNEPITRAAIDQAMHEYAAKVAEREQTP